MRKGSLRPTLLVAAIVASCSSYTVFGAEHGVSAFEEIVVTAQKRQQSIYDVPVAISAFNGDSIKKSGAQNLIDVGKLVPNLSVTGFSAGNGSSANPFIRGIGLQDHLITTDPGVSVYIDGVYLGRQIGQNWDLTNIQRLEVLRGPQGTLYGRNSIGGAINIITYAPGDEEVTRSSVEVGTRGRVNLDFYNNFKFSDELSSIVSGGIKRREGIGKYNNIESPDLDVGELQDIMGRIAIKWSPTDDFDLTVSADAAKGDNGLRPYTTLIDEVKGSHLYKDGYRNSDVSADPYDSNSGQADQTRTTYKASGVSLTAEYVINDLLDAKFLVSRRTSDYRAGLDDDGLKENLHTYPEIGFADQVSVELQLNGDLGNLDFVTGLYYFNEEGGNSNLSGARYKGSETMLTLRQDSTSYAVYVNLGYDVSEDLRVSGGLRYTEDEKEAFASVGGPAIFTEQEASFNETTWEIASTYEVNERMSVYGAIQNGYQSGQFPARPFCLFGQLDDDLLGALPAQNCFDATENVTALNYELGIKGEPLEILQMSLAVFQTEYDNLVYQISDATADGFNTRNIPVTQDSFGIEWESKLHITENFTLGASVGYIDTEVKASAADDPNGVAVAPLTPEHTASLSPEYTVLLSDGGLLTFHVDYSLRGNMFGEPTSDPGRFTKIESRELVNFDISYLSADETWTVGLYGRNVFDERYDDARLNTGDYLLIIKSNDPSEFGIRFSRDF